VKSKVEEIGFPGLIIPIGEEESKGKRED